MTSRTKFAIATAAALAAATSASAGEVRIRLHGVQSGEGKVRLALFRGQQAYEAGDQLAGVFVPAKPQSVEVVFVDLPADTYAISSFHDRNGNAQLDRNLVGMPTEPFGFSNDARGSFGPPSYEQMSFAVGDAPLALEIHLR